MPTYLSPGVYVEEIRRFPSSIDEVQTSTAGLVDETLSRSTAFAELPEDGRREVADDATRILTAILTASPPTDGAPGPFDVLIAAVDFPNFVADLIDGVFAAVIDMSIEQMEAYAELIAAVASSLDERAAAPASECQARDLLARLLLAGGAASASCARR